MAILLRNSDLPIPVEPTTYMCLLRSSCLIPKRTFSFLKLVSPKKTVSVGSGLFTFKYFMKLAIPPGVHLSWLQLSAVMATSLQYPEDDILLLIPPYLI